jgi:hypothetical protein
MHNKALLSDKYYDALHIFRRARSYIKTAQGY